MPAGLFPPGTRLGNLLMHFTGGVPTDPLLKRQQEHFARFDQHRPLAEYDFTVLDTELTGLDPNKDDIVSIAAVRIRHLAIDPCDNFHSLVEPRVPLSKASTLIHRITPDQVRGMPRLRSLLPSLLEFCSTSLIVGHYIGLDMGFLNRAARTVLGAPLMNPCVDTLRLARIYQEGLWENYYDRFQGGISYNLRDLALRFDLPVFPQHDALQDAMQTAYLFLFLVKKLRQGGIETLRDLYNAGRSWRWYL